jgi:hypothetical protein
VNLNDTETYIHTHNTLTEDTKMNITRQTASELNEEYKELLNKVVILDTKITNKIKSLVSRYNKMKSPDEPQMVMPSDYFIYGTMDKLKHLNNVEMKLKPFEPVQLKMDL